MKKTLLLLLLCLCGIQSFGQSTGTLNIAVEPRIELLTIVQYLAEQGVYPAPSSYHTDVQQWFRKYRKHEVVQQLRTIMPRGAPDAAFPQVALYCTPLPEFRPALPLTHYQDAISRSGYFALCRDFAEKADFTDFMDTHRPQFQQWTAQVRDTILRYQLTTRLEQYLGYPRHWHIYLSPLVSWGAYNFALPTPEKDREVHFVLGFNKWNKSKTAGRQPPFFADRNTLIDLIWHEGSHSYITPLVQRDSARLTAYSHLLTPAMQTQLQQAGRFTWRWDYYLNELCVRAIVARLTALHFGQQAGEAELQRQEQKGIADIRRAYALLESYEQGADGKNIGQFWQALVTDLPNWKR